MLRHSPYTKNKIEILFYYIPINIYNTRMQLNLRSGNVIIKTFNTGIPLRSGHIVKRTKFTPRHYNKKGIHLRSGRLVKRSKIIPRPYNRKPHPSTSISNSETPSITISIVPISSPQQSTRIIQLRSRSVNLNFAKRTPRPYKKKQPQNSHVEAMKDYYKNHFLSTYLNLRYYENTEEEAINKIRDWQSGEQRHKEWQAKHNPKNYLLDDYY
jgi:hypothetical protein